MVYFQIIDIICLVLIYNCDLSANPKYSFDFFISICCTVIIIISTCIALLNNKELVNPGSLLIAGICVLMVYSRETVINEKYAFYSLNVLFRDTIHHKQYLFVNSSDIDFNHDENFVAYLEQIDLSVVLSGKASEILDAIYESRKLHITKTYEFPDMNIVIDDEIGLKIHHVLDPIKNMFETVLTPSELKHRESNNINFILIKQDNENIRIVFVVFAMSGHSLKYDGAMLDIVLIQ